MSCTIIFARNGSTARFRPSLDAEITVTRKAEAKELPLGELARAQIVRTATIALTALGGMVTLFGLVRRFREGLSLVIEPGLPFDLKGLDEDSTGLAIDQSADPAKEAVEAATREGWVFVTDEQGWRFEQEATRRMFNPRGGVAGARDRSWAKSRIDTLNLSEDIGCALASSPFRPSSVNVTAVDGHITLTGYVSSWNDLTLTDCAAWAAPGATVVQNHLVVRAWHDEPPVRAPHGPMFADI